MLAKRLIRINVVECQTLTKTEETFKAEKIFFMKSQANAWWDGKKHSGFQLSNINQLLSETKEMYFSTISCNESVFETDHYEETSQTELSRHKTSMKIAQEKWCRKNSDDEFSHSAVYSHPFRSWQRWNVLSEDK